MAIKKWAEVETSPDFQALDRAGRETVRDEYFQQVVKPQVPFDQLGSVYEAFRTRSASAIARENLPAGVSPSSGGRGASGPTAADMRSPAGLATAKATERDKQGRLPQASMLDKGLNLGRDLGLSLVKGAVQVPRAAVGLADIVAGGRVGKALEEAGYRPDDALKILEDMQSGDQATAQARFDAESGIIDKAKAAIQNPRLIATGIAESLPAMSAGGVIGRGLGAIAPKLAPMFAGAAGEGVVAAGSQASDIRNETADRLLTPKQAAIAAGSGLATGLIGAGANKLSGRLGIGDVDTMLAGGAGASGKGGVVKKVIGGAASEGLLEEAPQSVAETVSKNAALDRDLGAGLDSAIAMGALTGGAMGAAGGAMRRTPVAPATIDQTAADHGIPPKAAARIKDQAEALPPEQRAGFVRRAFDALERQGLAKKPGAGTAFEAAQAAPAAPGQPASTPEVVSRPVVPSAADMGWATDDAAPVPAAPPADTAATGMSAQPEPTAQPSVAAAPAPMWQGQPIEPAGQPIVGPDGRQYQPVMLAGKPQFVPLDEITQGSADAGRDPTAVSGSDAARGDQPSRGAEDAGAGGLQRDGRMGVDAAGTAPGLQADPVVRDGSQPDAALTGGEPVVVGSYKTAKGSIYRMHADGTTSRDKAARDDIGHEGDSGKKPRSAMTVYIRPDKGRGVSASMLSAAGLEGAGSSRVFIKSGRAYLAMQRPDGKWGMADSVRDGIEFSTTPEVGMEPLELWKPAQKDGPFKTADHVFRGMHAGNAISEITKESAANVPTTQDLGAQGSAPQSPQGSPLASGAQPVGAEAEGSQPTPVAPSTDSRPAVGLSFDMDGQRWSVTGHGKRSVSITSDAGRTRTVAPDSPTWAKMAQALPTAQDSAQQPATTATRTPKVRSHPQAVRGSTALAAISRTLGGLSPGLLADLSQKTQRTRVARSGRKSVYTQWDNPAIPGVGPLFRNGGTADLSLVAQSLEDAGYLTPRTVARDPIAAQQQAQEIIRTELNQGGQTLQAGNPDAVEAEARQRADAAMDDGRDPWQDFDFMPDDLEFSGFEEVSAEVQSAVMAITAEAEAAGIDIEAIRDEVARQIGEEAPQHEYEAAVQQSLADALAEARRPVQQAQPGRAIESSGSGRQAAEPPSAARSDRADGPDGAVRPEQAADLTLSTAERADGTLAVEGPTKKVRKKLQDAGVPAKSIIDTKRGVTVGKTQAQKAKAVLAQPDNSALDLTAQTAEDLRSKTEREAAGTKAEAAEQKRLSDKAKADAQRAEFVLSGSESYSDIAASFGQGLLLDDRNPTAPESPKDGATGDAESGQEQSPPSAADVELDAELQDALGRLGDVLGDVFGAKLNATGQQYGAADLLPALSKVVELLVRKGFRSFKDAAGKAAEVMRADARTAQHVDSITPRQWKAAYDAIAEGHEGTDGEAAMAAMTAADVKAIVAAKTKEQPRAPSTNTRVEPDRGNAEAAPSGDGRSVQGRGDRVPGESGRDGKAGRPTDEGLAGDAGLRAGGPPVVRDGGDLALRGDAADAKPAGRTPGVDDDQRGGGLGDAGVQPDASPASQVARDAEKRAFAVGDRQAAQVAADKVAVKLADAENIRATLPLLLDGQRDDVLKAEQRFMKPDGYGMLFTNQPGTGKTYTGLGVIKRFARQGKTNSIIVAPTDKVIEDWIKSGAELGLTITQLSGTSDAGKGIVITTYANFGQNDALAQREWDLVVHDESHYLMQEAGGKDTKALDTLRAISRHPRGAYGRFRMLHAAELAEQARLSAQITSNEKGASDTGAPASQRAELVAENEKLKLRRDALTLKLDAARKAVEADVKAKQGPARTRVAMLSATPFAYEKTVDYAEGYLFDYESADGARYNSGDGREQFFMQHFGYRMRHNKLTAPDAKVDGGLMQRQFNTWLKSQGALSGRMLDVEPDYDRRFILVDSAIGTRIDEALGWISEKATEARQANKLGTPNGYSLLADAVNEKFDYLSRRYLLEAAKANEVLPHVREHLAMGRKVVVFHDYKKGGGFNPFRLGNVIDVGDSAADGKAFNGALAEFRREFGDLIAHPFEDMPSPVELFKREIPGVLLFNGDVKPADRRAAVASFQSDDNGPQVILVQSAAGKEGISLHDTTGKHQRVLFNLGQPTQPTTAIQQEGRIYRTGQKTNAIVRYLNTGTNWERWAFASTIAQRASAAENLGMGESARALKDAFIAAFDESSGDHRAGMEDEGVGGKERDRAANNALTEYDRARSFYFGTQKKNSKTKAQEGKDYFATPEPLGFKMVEWLGLRGGEKFAEPSAGHGAIARWAPDNTENTAIEPSMVLRSRLAMTFDGTIIPGDFESLHVNNKFDGIAMNPPFGVGGKQAVEHLAKAAGHLRDGGRVAAIIPTGPAADKRFDAWFYEEAQRPLKPLGVVMIDGKEAPIYKGDTIESSASWAPTGKVTGWRDGAPMVTVAGAAPGSSSMVSPAAIKSVKQTGPRAEAYRPADGLVLVADIKLPDVTFERAGTSVMTRMVVIDKLAKDQPAPGQVSRDLTSIEDVNALFDRLERMEIPARTKPVDAEQDAPVQPVQRAAVAKQEVKAQAAATAEAAGVQLVEYTAAKGKVIKGVIRKDLTADQAKEVDPYTFRKDGGMFIRAEHLAKLNEKFPASTRYSFAGQRAKTADKHALSTAQQRIKAGDDAELVRQETGWHKGRDGKWRFEISDADAKLKIGHKGVPISQTTAGVTQSNGWMRLADILDHGRLFAAYPQLADVQVKLMQHDVERGSFSPNDRSITLDGDLPQRQALGTLLHEIQHAIQTVEGFATGGSAADAFADPRMRSGASKAGLAAANKLLTERLLAMNTPMTVDEFARQAWGSSSVTGEIRASHEQYLADVAKASRSPAAVRSAQQWASQEWYRRLAGEVEARNTQARQAMTAEQRRATAPSSTADVPDSDVIVTFNGREMKLAPAPANFNQQDADLSRVTAVADAIRSKWANSPPVVVLADMADPQVPDAVREADHLQRSQGAAGAVEGFWYDGQVYLVSSALPSEADITRVLAHEVLGHHGLRGVFGDALDGVLDRMARALPDRIAEKAQQYGLDVADQTQRREAAEELLASIAESRPSSTWVQKAVAAAREFLRGLGLNLKLTDADITAQYLAPARGWVERGGRGAAGGAAPVRFSAAQIAQAADVSGLRAESTGKISPITRKPEFRVFDGAGNLVNTVRSGAATEAEAVAVTREMLAKRIAAIASEPAVMVSPESPSEKKRSNWKIVRAEEFNRSDENDGYLYHVTSYPAARSILVDGLAPDSGAMFGSSYAAHSSGRVFVTERSGVDFWSEKVEQQMHAQFDSPPAVAIVRIERSKVTAPLVDDPIGSKDARAPAYFAQGVTLFSRRATPPARDPTTESALRKAGLVKSGGIKEKLKGYFDAAMQVVRTRSELGDAFVQGTLDQFHGINRAVKREVGNLPAEQDPYVAARLANSGTSSVMRGLLLHGQAQWAANGQHLEKIDGTRGLLDVLGELGPDLNDWFGWMIGNRAASLMAEGRENNFTADEIAALQALGAGKEEKFRKVSREYAAFKGSVLDVAEKAGLIDGEARKVWDKADYIPFYRQMDNAGSLNATGKKGLAGQSSGIRTLLGGTEALNDPMENVIMNFSRLIDASLKNNALRRTVDILGSAASETIEKIGYDNTQVSVPAAWVKKMLVDAGMSPQVMSTLPASTFAGMAKLWTIAPPTDPDVIRIMRNGKPEFYRVHDPLLLRAATSFIPFNFPGLDVMRAFKRVLTGAVTATPEFMMRNFIRDAVASAIITRDGFNPGRTLAGIAKSWREDGAAEAMLFAGASFQSGNVNAADPEGTASAMRRALGQRGMDATAVNSFMGTVMDGTASAWERYRRAGDAVENSSREAVYEAAVRAGKGATAAAFEAKDLMDFSLRGSAPVYQFFADVLPFFNARVQGLYRLGRADPKRVARYGMLMMVASLALAAANSGNDEYEKLPDWDKDTSWHVWIGGQHFRFPKPFELGVAFATIPERIMRYAAGDDSGKKASTRIWENVRDQLAFDFVPQMFRPVLDVYANKDSFRGSPIESQADEGKRPTERYSASTSATAKVVTDAIEPVANEIGLSPKRLEFMVSGYLGTVGMYALGLSDMAVRALQDEAPRPALRADDIPVVKAFYRADPGRGSVFENDLYEMRKHFGELQKSVKALEREGDMEKAGELRTKYAKELAAGEVIDSGSELMAPMIKQRDAIYRSRAMTPDQKRIALDRLSVQKSDLAKTLMDVPAVKALR